MSVFPFKKAAVTLLLLTAAYFSGFGIHYLFSQPTTVLPASSSSEGNWGLSFQEEGVRPVGNATPSELAKYQAAYADETDEKVIYLTFDAGYENGNLPAILDALKNHQAVGTFFVVGNFLETSPELTKRMVAEGHIVGNHTYHHPDMSKISTKEAFEKELNDVKTLFQSITGSEMAHYYRPPQPTKEQAFSKLLSRIHPGAVVLLHSTSSTNAAILDELLTKWEEMGYHFAPLSELADKL